MQMIAANLFHENIINDKSVINVLMILVVLFPALGPENVVRKVATTLVLKLSQLPLHARGPARNVVRSVATTLLLTLAPLPLSLTGQIPTLSVVRSAVTRLSLLLPQLKDLSLRLPKSTLPTF